jgi:NTE family protein
MNSSAGIPKLALVLGSGGVKSIAGLGVADTLESHGIKPDLIVGCSGGAIFGALLAMGFSAEKSAQTATSLWSREITSGKRKSAWLQLARSTLPGRGNPAFADQFAFRSDEKINQRLFQAFGTVNIEDLPIEFRVRATDALTGEPVLINSGRLTDALRASVALPFLFKPHRVNDRLLIDGSVSDPLPISGTRFDNCSAQSMVVVGFPVPLPKYCDGPTRLATRLTASLTNNLMDAHIAANAGPGMVALAPSIGRRVGLFETEAMPALIEAGRRCTWQQLERIRTMFSRSTVDSAAGASYATM